MFEFETIKIDGKIYISDYKTDEDIITIPVETTNGEKIYGINSFAFVGQKIRELTIPEEIKDIKENAFIDCYNLETVSLYIQPDKNFFELDKCFIKEINNILFIDKREKDSFKFESDKYIVIKYTDIFKNKKTIYTEAETEIFITELPNLEDLYIPDTYKGKEISLEKMHPYFFDRHACSVKKIRVPKRSFNKPMKIPYLEEICFSSETTTVRVPLSNSLKKVVLYDKVEQIYLGEMDLSKLEEFTIDETIKNLKHFYVENIEISPWYKRIKRDKYDSINYKGLLLDIPDYIKNYIYIMPPNVLFIKNELFKNSKLKEIKFNNRIKNIGQGCFEDCFDLKKVIIPKNIKYIGKYAFYEESEESSEYSKEVIFDGNKESIKIEEGAFETEIWLPFR